MYLTRIQLDLTKTKTMQALVAPKLFHGAIECRAGGKNAETLEIGYPQWKSVSSDFDRISAGFFGSCKAIWHRDMCRNQKI